MKKEKQSNCGIYYIQNILTNQLYIGQSKDMYKRKIRHFSKLRKNNHENPHLQNSFNKYGENNFKFQVIQYCNESELDELEIAYMNLYNVKKHGFNISDGGHDGGWSKEYAHIKLSSFDKYNRRMYALVYKNQIIRSVHKQFLEYLLTKYFDEKGQLLTNFSFNDLKKEAKKNMGYRLIPTARIVKKGIKKNNQVYAIKYGKNIIKISTNYSFLEYLLDKYFDEDKILKQNYTIEDIKTERIWDCYYVRKGNKEICA